MELEQSQHDWTEVTDENISSKKIKKGEGEWHNTEVAFAFLFKQQQVQIQALPFLFTA